MHFGLATNQYRQMTSVRSMRRTEGYIVYLRVKNHCWSNHMICEPWAVIVFDKFRGKISAMSVARHENKFRRFDDKFVAFVLSLDMTYQSWRVTWRSPRDSRPQAVLQRPVKQMIYLLYMQLMITKMVSVRQRIHSREYRHHRYAWRAPIYTPLLSFQGEHHR